MIEAHIDFVSPVGIVDGWARHPSQPGPVNVTLWLEGIWVGSAIASAFRQDLIAAGIGHGHYAYRCKISCNGLAAGRLELREAGSDAPLTHCMVEPGHLIEDRQKQRRTVESLLVAPKRWSMDEVASHLEALDLEASLLARGPRYYVATIYRFLLNRWPDQGEFDFYLPDMRRGLLSATDIFRIIYESAECRNSRVEPLSPYDPKYPFRAVS